MNRSKLLYKFLKFTLIILVFFFCLYSFLLSDYNPMFDDETFKSLNKELVDSRRENLDSIPELYCKLYKVKSVKSFIFSNRFGNKDCPSLDIVRLLGYRLRGNIKLPFIELIYALKIEKDYTLNECLTLLFLKSDYCFGNTGVKEASNFYFKKKISNLNQREKLTLVAMLDNPSFFNPIRRPEKSKYKVDLFEKIIKNKTN